MWVSFGRFAIMFSRRQRLCRKTSAAKGDPGRRPGWKLLSAPGPARRFARFRQSSPHATFSLHGIDMHEKDQRMRHDQKSHESTPPIEHAHRRTGKVRDDLQVAGAELGLAHDALEQHLPAEAKQGDVAWALGQNEAVEQKLEDAVEELGEVTELLQEEAAERARLQRRLDRSGKD
jgi:hypothetical protein